MAKTLESKIIGPAIPEWPPSPDSLLIAEPFDSTNICKTRVSVKFAHDGPAGRQILLLGESNIHRKKVNATRRKIPGGWTQLFGKDSTQRRGGCRESGEEGSFGNLYPIKRKSMMPLGAMRAEGKGMIIFYSGALEIYPPECGGSDFFKDFADEEGNYTSDVEYVYEDGLPGFCKDYEAATGHLFLHKETIDMLASSANLKNGHRLEFKMHDSEKYGGSRKSQLEMMEGKILIPERLRSSLLKRAGMADKTPDDSMRFCRAYLYPEKNASPYYAQLVLETDYFVFDQKISVFPKKIGEAHQPQMITSRAVKGYVLENFTGLMQQMVADYLVR